MWKRMQNKTTGGGAASQRPVIGGPVLVETSLDESAYQNMRSTNLSPVEEGAAHSSRVSRRPVQEHFSQQDQQYDDAQYSRNNNTAWRPPSSVYSQPSPTPRTTTFPHRSAATPATAIADGVSPPSSPEFGATQDHSNISPDISPIDDQAPPIPPYNRPYPTSQGRQKVSTSTAPGSQPTAPKESNIPQLRREKRRQSAATANNTRQAEEPSQASIGVKKRWNPPAEAAWDSYTGEPVPVRAGKPQSVKPSQYSGDREHTGLRSASLSSDRPSGQQDPRSFRERLRKTSAGPMPAPRAPGSGPGMSRPEWKGASGRQAIVTPVEELANKPAFTAPVKKRPVKPVPKISPPDPHKFANSANKSIPLFEAARTPTPPSAELQPPPRNLSRSVSPGSPTEIPRSNASPLDDRLMSGNNYTTTAPESNHGVRKVSNDSPITRKPVSTHFPDTQATSLYEALSNNVSSISISQKPNDWASIPAQEEGPKASVMERPRPIQISGEGEKTTTRKAVPRSPVFVSMTERTSKLLPKSPPEMDPTADLISHLQAQLDNLAHVRINLERSIHQMTELMPQNNDYGVDAIRRRADERLKVESLKNDLAEVRREEHELGLKLHRAFKRQAKEAAYEPTTLWVRRVTE